MAKLKVNQKRKYVIPLRNEFLKVPRWRRSKRAIKTIQDYIIKHTKTENVRLSKWINGEIWNNGGKNPPGKIKIEVELKEREVQDKKTKKKLNVPFAIAELSELPEKAKREKRKSEKEEKERKKKREEKLKKKSKEKKQSKKTKKSKSTKELAKELKKKEKKAKVTKSQEANMHE